MAVRGPLSIRQRIAPTLTLGPSSQNLRTLHSLGRPRTLDLGISRRKMSLSALLHSQQAAVQLQHLLPAVTRFSTLSAFAFRSPAQPFSRSRLLQQLRRCTTGSESAASSFQPTGGEQRLGQPFGSTLTSSQVPQDIAAMPADTATATTTAAMSGLPLHPCGSPAIAQSGGLLSPLKRARPTAIEHLLPGQQHFLPAHPYPGNFGPVGHHHPQQAVNDLAGADLGKALKSVCKVFATIARYKSSTGTAIQQPVNIGDVSLQVHQQTKSTASGFVIAPLSARRILTNAHAVANQIQVQLRKHGNAKKFTAKVLAVGHECDVAMLTVEDDEFWKGVEALELGEVPAMQESVSVVGYPTGGDNVCVTKGVVSRIDRQQYSHGRTSLMALQIDAAINSGNSGGPVLKGDRIVGIAFQCLTQGENIGYVIPTLVVEHFLNDLKRNEGRYTGFCDLGVCWQTLESNDHKAALGMPADMTGVYVTAVEPCYHASQVVQAGDVITHFNGHAIADDGTFMFQPHGYKDSSTLTSPQPQQDVTARTTQLLSAGNSSNGSETASHTHAASPPTSTSGAAPRISGSGNGIPSTQTMSMHTQAKAAAQQPSSLQVYIPSSQQGAVMVQPPTPNTALALAQYHHQQQQQQAVRIDFRHLVAMNFAGDSCELNVWRDRAALAGVKVKLSNPKQLVPVHSHDLKPHYFIYGGLVFTRLTNFYLRSTYGTDWTHKAPIKLCDRSFAGVMEHEGQECVILSKVLAWECNAGYQEMGNVEVLKVAGVPVHNLSHLAHILVNHPGPYVRLDLAWNKVVILDTARCRAAAKDILMQNCIPGSGHFPENLITRDFNLPEHLKEPTEAAIRSKPAETTSSPAEEVESPTAGLTKPPCCRVPSMNTMSNRDGPGVSSGGQELASEQAATSSTASSRL